MISLSSASRVLAAAGVAAVAAVEPAFAGSMSVPAVPAPIVGAGIPGLIAFAGGYWALRNRKK
ncbi:MAG: hypothetical protein JWN69_990 [Alphaproteobacteria bacterium]|jgi:hypothetical protein|nr:hypothetical protein [Alphaproteobacteria bacterium]